MSFRFRDLRPSMRKPFDTQFQKSNPKLWGNGHGNEHGIGHKVSHLESGSALLRTSVPAKYGTQVLGAPLSATPWSLSPCTVLPEISCSWVQVSLLYLGSLPIRHVAISGNAHWVSSVRNICFFSLVRKSLVFNIHLTARVVNQQVSWATCRKKLLVRLLSSLRSLEIVFSLAGDNLHSPATPTTKPPPPTGTRMA
jgi:hypothetical protein